MNTQDLRVRIGLRLKLAREHAGLTQGQAAKILGMHRPSISEIEAGRRKVSAEELNLFAQTYGVEIQWLTLQEGDTLDQVSDKLKLAARKLSQLDESELDDLLNLLSALRNKPRDQ